MSSGPTLRGCMVLVAVRLGACDEKVAQAPGPAHTADVSVARARVVPGGAAVGSLAVAVDASATAVGSSARAEATGASSSIGPIHDLDIDTHSNVQLVQVGEGLLAVWPGSEDDVTVQPLDGAGAPRGPATMVALPGSAALYAFVALGAARRTRCCSAIAVARATIAAAWPRRLPRRRRPTGGVLTASTYDDTLRGYTEMACDGREEEPAPSVGQQLS